MASNNQCMLTEEVKEGCEVSCKDKFSQCIIEATKKG